MFIPIFRGFAFKKRIFVCSLSILAIILLNIAIVALAIRYRRDSNFLVMGNTIVVASSESKNKNSADYICDGSDDQVEIQAAVDALPREGGKVIFLEGKYNIDEGKDHGGFKSAILIPHIDNGAHITIEGAGGSTIFVLRTDAYAFAAAGTGYYEPEASSRLVFRNLTFDALEQNKGGAIFLEFSSYSSVENNWFFNLSDGVTFLKSYKNNISNNVFEGVSRSILLAESHDCLVSGNSDAGFENSGRPDFPISSMKIIGGFETIVTSNSIEHIYDKNESSVGIWIVDSADTIITSNSLEECDTGIKITGKYPFESYYLTTTLVSNNSLRDNPVNLVVFNTCQAMITDNVFTGFARSAGIKIMSKSEKISIISNTFNNYSAKTALIDDGSNKDINYEPSN